MTDLRSIRIQTNRNAARPCTRRVAIVIPVLGTGNLYLLRGVGVGDVVAIDGRRISIHRILCDGVLDLCSVVIFRQILELVLPAISCRDLLTRNLRAIGEQVYCDRRRTLVISVVVIGPRLCNGNSYHIVVIRKVQVHHACATFTVNLCLQMANFIVCHFNLHMINRLVICDSRIIS